MKISLQAHLYFWIMQFGLRPLLSEDADIPQVRERLESMDYWGRHMDSGFLREEDQVEGIPCQWLRIPGAARERVVLYLHGGGFCTRTPVTHGQLLASICKQVGASGLMPDYRLAPEHPFPASFEDCFAVYRWLLDSGFDAGRIVLAGDSAGGALVLGTLVQARDAGLPLPACAVMISPWSGRPFIPNSGAVENDALLSNAAVTAFYRAWKPDSIPEHPLANLNELDFSNLPPVLIQAGGNEILLPDAEEWADKVKLAGGHAILQVFPGMAHAFPVAGFLPESKAAIENMAGFINQFLT